MNDNFSHCDPETQLAMLREIRDASFDENNAIIIDLSDLVRKRTFDRLMNSGCLNGSRGLSDSGFCLLQSLEERAKERKTALWTFRIILATLAVSVLGIVVSIALHFCSR